MAAVRFSPKCLRHCGPKPIPARQASPSLIQSPLGLPLLEPRPDGEVPHGLPLDPGPFRVAHARRLLSDENRKFLWGGEFLDRPAPPNRTQSWGRWLTSLRGISPCRRSWQTSSKLRIMQSNGRNQRKIREAAQTPRRQWVETGQIPWTAGRAWPLSYVSWPGFVQRIGYLFPHRCPRLAGACFPFGKLTDRPGRLSDGGGPGPKERWGRMAASFPRKRIRRCARTASP